MNTFIVGEAGVNWRNLDEADKMIKECADAGVDAVKFQMFKEEHIKEHPRFNELKNIILTESDVRYLYWRARARGIDLIITPFYPEAIDILNPYVKRWKIRYSDRNNMPLIEKCRTTLKPLLISSDETTRKFTNPDFNYLYCVPEYPPTYLVRINETDISKFDGFSCHFPWICIPERMLRECPNMKYLEVHVKRDVYDPPYCPIDNAVSITITELKELVERIRAI